MDKRILNWLRENVGETFESPRKKVFKIKRVFPVKIISVDEEKEILRFKFVGGNIVLPLYFWMFEKALDYIKSKKDKVVRLGAKVAPPYDENTVEGQIWREPLKSPFKASPHVCDILVLSGIANYEETKNPKTKKNVQGIRYITDNEVPTARPSPPYRYIPKNKALTAPLSPQDPKQEFIKKYKETIIGWTESKKEIIKDARLSYSWKNKPMLVCVKERNEVSKAIIMARIRNHGGIDLDTLDKVTRWGFNREFPFREEKEVIKITKKAFNCLDNGKLVKATKILLDISKVGISRASKILGLFDQENLCIYDSRVGNAMKDLIYDNSKLVLCPPGYLRPGDIIGNAYGWADQYQQLIWTLEIIRDNLNSKGFTYRLADVEMALFMLGK